MKTPRKLRPFYCVCGESCDHYAKCKRKRQVTRPCGRSNPKLGDKHLMKTKHTPGPWWSYKIEWEKTMRLIATQEGVPIGYIINPDNARLVIAAPTLYNLVRAWLLTDPHDEHSAACSQIIAKIEGGK